jgi:hypothetical protein
MPAVKSSRQKMENSPLGNPTNPEEKTSDTNGGVPNKIRQPDHIIVRAKVDKVLPCTGIFSNTSIRKYCGSGD